ncbi:MAG: hypothetical protein R3E95_11405 [Thiolinea sp.]
MPVLDAKFAQGQKLVLQGKLGSQQEIDNLLQVAGEQFETENVVNELALESGLASPEWLHG